MNTKNNMNLMHNILLIFPLELAYFRERVVNKRPSRDISGPSVSVLVR